MLSSAELVIVCSATVFFAAAVILALVAGMKFLLDLRRDMEAKFELHTTYRHNSETKMFAQIQKVDLDLGDRVKRLEDLQLVTSKVS